MTRTCRVCGTEFEKEDVPKEWLYNSCECSRECHNKRKRKQRERYKREGKCTKCGEATCEDSVLCQKCLDKNNKRTKRIQESYKKEGKCVRCGEPACDDSVLCQECLDKMKEKYKRYKREGKCSACGDELPTDGRNWGGVYCPECQEKYRNYGFRGEWATDAEIRNGLHTEMVENKLDLED